MSNYVDTDYVVARLINSLGTAEGSSLPLRVKAGVRVPVVTNLKVVKKERIERGTQITLTWTEPEPLSQISHHIVYLTEFSAVTQNTIGSYISKRSPINIRILGDEDVPITFTVTTVLNNGQSSLFTDSPSVSSRTIENFVEPGDTIVSYLPYPPITTLATFVPAAYPALTCFSDTGGGRIIGIGCRVIAPLAGLGEGLYIDISVDGSAPQSTPLVTASAWEHPILSLPGSGALLAAANDWRYYHLSTPYNSAASVTAYRSATTAPGTFSVEIIVYYEKTV